MQFKNLTCSVDEVGKLMLSHKIIHVLTHAGYPIIVYQCYIPELHSGTLEGAQGCKLSTFNGNTFI